MHWGEAVGEVIVDSWGINGGGIGEVLVEAIREAGREGGRQ